MWNHKPEYGKIVYFFVSKRGFSNLSSLSNRISYTDNREIWETSGRSTRIGPDVLGEWQ